MLVAVLGLVFALASSEAVLAEADSVTPVEEFSQQIDQLKQTFTTLEPAEAMGRGIKNAHPIVQVSIYDAVDCTNTMIEAEAEAKA